MAGKRKAKRVAEDLSKPSPWRMQHGGFGDPEQLADPEGGPPVVHRRVIDTLGLMLANGTITSAMHDAALVFRGQFRTAALDGVRTSPLLRLAASSGEQVTDRQIDARRRVSAVLDALGGHGSAAGSCVWHVVGREASLREWARRQGWNGRPVGHSQAQGILVAALGMLAAQYRIGPLDRGESIASPKESACQWNPYRV